MSHLCIKQQFSHFAQIQLILIDQIILFNVYQICRRAVAGGAAGGGPAHHQQHRVRGHVREGRLQGAHPPHLHLRRLQGGRQGQLRGG